MATRTTTKQVTFRRPFLLAGFAAVQAAGTYTIETDEEIIDELSYPVWRRSGTTLHLQRGGGMEFVPIDPEELSRALLRDGAQPETAKNAGRGCARQKQAGCARYRSGVGKTELTI